MKPFVDSANSKGNANQRQLVTNGSFKQFKIKLAEQRQKGNDTPRKLDLQALQLSPRKLINLKKPNLKLNNSPFKQRKTDSTKDYFEGSITQNKTEPSPLLTIKKTSDSREKKYKFFHEAQNNKNYGTNVLANSTPASPEMKISKEPFFQDYSPLSVKLPNPTSVTRSQKPQRFLFDAGEEPSLHLLQRNRSEKKFDFSPNSPLTMKVKQQLSTPFEAPSKSRPSFFFADLDLPDVISRSIPSNKHPLSDTDRCHSSSRTKSELSRAMQQDIINELAQSPIDSRGKFNASKLNEYGFIQIEDQGSMTDRVVTSKSRFTFTRDSYNSLSPRKTDSKPLKKLEVEDEMVVVNNIDSIT